VTSFTVILRPLDYGTATRGNQSLSPYIVTAQKMEQMMEQMMERLLAEIKAGREEMMAEMRAWQNIWMPG
jgi:hypothetical protein